jgi:cation diffusion facilitator family transporter
MNTILSNATPTAPVPAQHDEARDRRDANKAVVVSAIGLAVTGGIELAVSVLTGSVALLGDAIHNLSDVSTSAVIFLGFWFSKREPTRTYSYGYERAEDIAGLGVALAIWLSALFAGYQSYHKLVAGTGTTHLGIGMAAAVLGMAGNLVVSRYKKTVARKIHSSTMEAEANHSWLDVVSSLGALIGLIGVALGLRWGDPVAGFAVTFFILHVGYEVTSDIVHHLMDGVEPEHLAAAETAARGIPGISGVSARGRWMGRTLVIDVDGELAPATTLEQAERIGRQVATAIKAADEEVRQVRFTPRAGARPDSTR